MIFIHNYCRLGCVCKGRPDCIIGTGGSVDQMPLLSPSLQFQCSELFTDSVQ